MRKISIPAVFILLLLLMCTACGKGPADPSETSAAAGVLLPVGPAEGNNGDDAQTAAPPSQDKGKSDLYDPSIFIIQAKGTWRQELAEGYYADYECELYIDKADANDHRVESGLYTGVFWMKTTLDTGEYLKDLLKDVPVEMGFNASGEGICDNLTVNLLAGYEREAWEDYAIPDGKDGALPLTQDMPVARGSFTAVGKAAYLEARAHGVQGEKLEHQSSQVADAEITYVMHVEPDPAKTMTERKVTIHLSDAQGMAVTLEGKWQRLPGYPEDMLEYANSGRYNDVLNRHIQ